MMEIPDDIRDLKAMIGEQRAIINEKDSEIDHVKGDLIQAQTELSLSKKQMIPTQLKLKEYVGTIGQLQTEITERTSEIMFKNDKLLNLENKINTLELTNQKLQKGTKNEIDELEQYSKNEIQKLEQKQSEERQTLKGTIRTLESELSEARLKKTEIETEASDSIAKYKELRESQEGLIQKVEELTKVKRENEDKAKLLNQKMADMSKDGIKIFYYDKLTQLMEHDDQFKAFLILEKVGALAIEDLQKALGSPSVMVGRFVNALKKIDLIEENDMGKLVVKEMELE
jgi:chromosome segregation ATPase